MPRPHSSTGPTGPAGGRATTFGGATGVGAGVGPATGDRTLREEGNGDQLGGKVQQRYGEAKNTIEDTLRPAIDQVRQFVRDRPFASAALGGVLGLALINTLRGK